MPARVVLLLALPRALGLHIGRRRLVLAAAATVAPPAPRAAASEAPPTDVVDLPNGCRYAVVARGTGETPRAGERVAVRLRGFLEDGGVVYDSGGAPLVFRVGAAEADVRADGPVTPAVDQAVRRMRGGERGRLVAPPEMGYGRGMSLVDTRRAGLRALRVPDGETLRYEIELLRCRDVAPVRGARARVCCAEEAYPCPDPPG